MKRLPERSRPVQAEIAKLDYMQLLPLFLDGIRETEDPYRFLAVKVDNHLQN